MDILLIPRVDSGGFSNFKIFMSSFVVEIVLKISASRKCVWFLATTKSFILQRKYIAKTLSELTFQLITERISFQDKAAMTSSFVLGKSTNDCYAFVRFKINKKTSKKSMLR